MLNRLSKTLGNLNVCILLLAISSSIISCGYTFQGSGSILPAEIKTIAITQVQNNTTEAGLGQRLAQALRLRFERYGAVEIIEDSSNADAVINSEINSLSTLVKSVTGQTDIELETELVLNINAQLVTSRGETLWADPSLSVYESFANISDVVVTSSSDFAQSGIGSGTLGSLNSREVSRGQERAALDELLDEAARKIYLSAIASSF